VLASAVKSVAVVLVGHPLRILTVGLMFLGAHLARQAEHGAPRSRAFLIAGVLWMLASAWELAVRVFSPEADIRVDLLVIGPVLAVVSLWALVRGWR